MKDGKRDPRLDWFTDRSFLHAIAHAIDKQAMIVNCLNGFGEPAVATSRRRTRSSTTRNLKDYEYDLDEARSCSTTAATSDRDGDGIIEDRNGNPVEFGLTTNAGNQVREKMCSILQGGLDQARHQGELPPADFTLLVEKLDTTFDWDAVLIGFTGGIEPNNGANLLRSSGNLHLWNPDQQAPATRRGRRRSTACSTRARASSTPTSGASVYWRIQEILHEQLPMIETVRETALHRLHEQLRELRPDGLGPLPAGAHPSSQPADDGAGFLLRARLLHMIPLLLGITFLAFLVIDLAPGDYFSSCKMNPSISPEMITELEREFGYGDPLLLRYGKWLWRVVHLDLGHVGGLPRQRRRAHRQRAPSTR